MSHWPKQVMWWSPVSKSGEAINTINGRTGKVKQQRCVWQEQQEFVAILSFPTNIRVSTSSWTDINISSRLNLETGGHLFSCNFSLMWDISLGSYFILPLLKCGSFTGRLSCVLGLWFHFWPSFKILISYLLWCKYFFFFSFWHILWGFVIEECFVLHQVC